MDSDAAKNVLTGIANGNRQEDAQVANGELQRMKNR
jgi:hypothetical protein